MWILLIVLHCMVWAAALACEIISQVSRVRSKVYRFSLEDVGIMFIVGAMPGINLIVLTAFIIGFINKILKLDDFFTDLIRGNK
jgi:hypothetical protein